MRLLRTKKSRAERSLYWRCRRGEPEALATFAYRVADDLYAMSLAACDDECSASKAVLEAWQRTLTRLGRWRFGGHLERHARREMLRGLRAAVGARRAKAAAKLSSQDFGDEHRPRLPEADVAQMAEQARDQAPVLQQRAARRRARSKFALWTLAALFVATLGFGVTWQVYLSQPSARSVRVRLLQERVLASDMANLVNDVADTLPDTDGANRKEAELYGQTVMALEEIANADNTAGTEGLYYVQQRVKELDLPAFLRDAAYRQEGSTQATLLQAQLALEEVEAL